MKANHVDQLIENGMAVWVNFNRTVAKLTAIAFIMTSHVLIGCASIVSETDSTTYIETEPEKARCELHGQDFRRVIDTPASVHLDADAAPVTVSCKADGYRETAEVLDTSMDGWILGNIIFGGIIGVAVDAARGAGQKFPPRFMVILDPLGFPTIGERDDWYDRRRRQVEEKWEKAVGYAEAQCNSGRDTDSDDCDREVGQLQAKRDTELEQIEGRRDRALVK